MNKAMKTCSDCGKDLPVSEFFKKGQSLTGKIYYQSRCKECHKKAARQCQQLRPPRTRELRNDKFIIAGYVCY